MNPTRNGKIARLPRSVREELNQRLHDGEQGKTLVAWLNALAEVQSMTARDFGGRPVREQNLSEWKQGGYRDWLTLQEARSATARLADETGGACDPASPPLTDTLSQWLAVRYAMATRQLEGIDGPEHLRLLHRLCGDIVGLRRGDHNAQRLELDRARLATHKSGSGEKWKNRLVQGVETLGRHIKSHPEAQAAFDSLTALLATPFPPPDPV